MSIYSELGIHRVINAAFAFTRLGGSTLPKEVQDAMNEANKSFVNMWDLNVKCSEIISKETGAEAAWITSGGFNGLVLSAAAFIAGKDPEKMRMLPHTHGMKNEFIIQRNNRLLVYDRAVEVAGGVFAPVGDEVYGCGVKEIESAINENTAGIHYVYPTGPTRQGIVPLKDMVKLAHSHSVPIMVDVCGITYPTSSFKTLLESGADLLAFGGKYVQGPNSSGFVLGKKEWVEAVSLHSFIGQEMGPFDAAGYYRSIGRGYKLDRQEIVGLTVAVKRWMKLDHEKERFKPSWDRIHYIEKHVRKLPRLKEAYINYQPSSGAGVSYHSIGLHVSFPTKSAEEVNFLVNKLREKDPEVWVRYYSGNTDFVINALYLNPGEEKIVVERFKEVFI